MQGMNLASLRHHVALQVGLLAGYRVHLAHLSYLVHLVYLVYSGIFWYILVYSGVIWWLVIGNLLWLLTNHGIAYAQLLAWGLSCSSFLVMSCHRLYLMFDVSLWLMVTPSPHCTTPTPSPSPSPSSWSLASASSVSTSAG